MIKYNNSNINDWYFSEDNIIKVYRNNAVCYYKVTVSSEQVPCFAVVENISSYSDTEFVDVYNKADSKWYKLNNLNQYEEYGVYGSGRTITYYDGKLTIDDGYEYQYAGSSWNNVGEISASTKLPQGYTEVEYIENTTQAYLNLDLALYDTTTTSYEIQMKFYSQSSGSEFGYIFGTEGTSSPYNGVQVRWNYNNFQMNAQPNNVTFTRVDNGDGTSGLTAVCSSTNATNGNNPLTLFCGLWSTGPWRNGKAKIYSFKVTKDGTLVRDLVPCMRDNDSMVGMYDIVNDVFYYPPNYESYQLVAGSAVTNYDYPIYYDEKTTPPNNLSFSSMTEAQQYQCPWVGMKVTIDGVPYTFNEQYQWEEIISTWVELTDIVASSTTSTVGDGIKISPTVSGITFIKVTVSATAYSSSYCWVTFGRNDNNSTEVFSLNNSSNNQSGGDRSVNNLQTLASDSSTDWVYWEDENHTALIIDVVKAGASGTVSYNNIKYQRNVNLSAYAFMFG